MRKIIKKKTGLGYSNVLLLQVYSDTTDSLIYEIVFMVYETTPPVMSIEAPLLGVLNDPIVVEIPFVLARFKDLGIYGIIKELEKRGWQHDTN